VISKKRKRGTTGGTKKNEPMGVRWPVERTNSWLSNLKQLRHNTDQKTSHRLAHLAPAIVSLLTAKLMQEAISVVHWSRLVLPRLWV